MVASSQPPGNSTGRHDSGPSHMRNLEQMVGDLVAENARLKASMGSFSHGGSYTSSPTKSSTERHGEQVQRHPSIRTVVRVLRRACALSGFSRSGLTQDGQGLRVVASGTSLGLSDPATLAMVASRADMPSPLSASSTGSSMIDADQFTLEFPGK